MRIILVLLMLSIAFSVSADEIKFSKKANGKPELIQTGPQKNWCPVCGMNLKMFYKTNHALKLTGGKNKQYCSIRCMFQDFEGLRNIIKEILVIDTISEKFINAANAHYVVGSRAPGTMTKTSKYAFSSHEDAVKFQKKMGGEIMSFAAAKKSVAKSMEKDIAMTDMKRQKKMYPKGKKIFTTACDKSISPFKYNLINELKADIKTNNLCGKLKEKELQAVALYLWDVVRKNERSEEFITVMPDEKCPVCGMFVHKYPKWASKITYSKNGKNLHSVFDGVKDQLKFYFAPAKWGNNYSGIKIDKLLVTDYYTNKAVNGKKAYYVISSDVYGPMGKELIPFADKENAETFMSDHNGREILTFDQITEKMIYELDE